MFSPLPPFMSLNSTDVNVSEVAASIQHKNTSVLKAALMCFFFFPSGFLAARRSFRGRRLRKMNRGPVWRYARFVCDGEGTRMYCKILFFPLLKCWMICKKTKTKKNNENAKVNVCHVLPSDAIWSSRVDLTCSQSFSTLSWHDYHAFVGFSGFSFWLFCFVSRRSRYM